MPLAAPDLIWQHVPSVSFPASRSHHTVHCCVMASSIWSKPTVRRRPSLHTPLPRTQRLIACGVQSVMLLFFKHHPGQLG